MTTHSLRKAILLAFIFMLFAPGHAQESLVCNMKVAREWCDGSMLSPIEGIWEYPSDATVVMIRKSATDRLNYDIILIESADTRLWPGEVVGYLKASASESKYEMGLYRDRKKGLLSNPGKCMAIFHQNSGRMEIEKPKIKFSIKSFWFLPSFWKALRISFDNPADKLPAGMIKIYPDNIIHEPDYL